MARYVDSLVSAGSGGHEPNRSRSLADVHVATDTFEAYLQNAIPSAFGRNTAREQARTPIHMNSLFLKMFLFS